MRRRRLTRNQTLEARERRAGFGEGAAGQVNRGHTAENMRKQTQSSRRRLLQEQSARYLNESELPFTVPQRLPVVASDGPATQTAAFDATHVCRKV